MLGQPLKTSRADEKPKNPLLLHHSTPVLGPKGSAPRPNPSSLSRGNSNLHGPTSKEVYLQVTKA